MNEITNQEKIKRIGYDLCDLSGYEIRPEFNINWYHNDDRYSEGDIEDFIIQLIMENQEKDYVSTIAQNFGWSTYYHLSHIRENILNWYPFPPDSSVLEIGCGMGAITNLLCQKCRKVTAVELSRKRATAAALRCRERENLEIIVGNLNDIEFQEKYDYITLIGVLEYQGTYTDSDNPYLDFLRKIKTLLKPQGKLLIAIENKYGIKYWCGAREDHTGIPFDGINQYQIGNANVRTFSKQRLANLISQSGFAACHFYYPMPDYKLPSVIYSENYLPKDGRLEDISPYYIPDSGTLIANEKALYDDLVDNHVFEFFANSFLVECADSADKLGSVSFAKLSCFRYRDCRVGTRILNNGRVEKFSLTNHPEGLAHLQQTYDSQIMLRQRGLNTLPSLLEKNHLCMNYNANPTMEELLAEAYRTRNTTLIWVCYDKWVEDILKSSKTVPSSQNIIFKLELDSPDSGISYGPILDIGYPDLIPCNCFIDDGKLIWFDQEWKFNNIPAGFILCRGLIYLYSSYPWMECILPLKAVLERYGVDEARIPKFMDLEQLFLNTTVDQEHLVCYCTLTKVDANLHRINIEKLCQPAN